ncbi:MAG: hypothetical protein A2131_02485 [Candidatus Sungbacteria bacterium GWC2_49_10]|uniref:Thymidylate synthase complementing protein ThyX n=2 Tax=Parcubacteria group TaxID=1794811 RepID=A0A0G1WS10_9BACT|nr:MAG: Thymidylate synthase complementing protein ThyX [Parcubacteria group bacterium GW2011_GWB1_50_9]KKW21618.1 MAG: Thymidylate synthase complementing protein ThyX [Candidatus Adlerbacteria bacterium GW2011_GWC1_50_9]OGZ94486.1 MAG: hypothetical protein A2131_02485 [Candidatus Sungbacteria bacterium GWC2_49_10]
MPRPIESFAPQFIPDAYTSEDRRRIQQFFTNLDRSVYALLIPSPELVGALCSRMSRATQDIRAIFLREFIDPFLAPDPLPGESDDAFAERRTYGNELRYFIEFLEAHPFETLFANPRARRFYVQWLAEYGDDSIAQMAGMHLAFSGISQVAIKHIENMRIGIAPIEKSTRYVDYSKKVNGRFLYYTDPSLEDLGLRDEYEAAMDGLFNTYTALIPRLAATLQKKFPDIPQKVIEKKAFDTLRGILPMATLSQVSFFGNGQAFEYMMARSLRHTLGEIRWAAEEAYRELSRIGPSFFRRLKGEAQGSAETYQEYLAGRKNRMAPFVKEFLVDNDRSDGITKSSKVTVRLIERDPEGEAKVIAGMLYEAPNCHRTWKEIYEEVLRMPQSSRERILRANLEGRDKRWQRVSRAFEHAYTLFEIEMNIGAWRDLHRHRMLTQEHQFFTCHHGFDTPPEIVEAGLLPEFSGALEKAKTVFLKIAARDPHLAQYAVPLAYRVRFIQRENLRQSFWQIELRTISQGHPDYRHVEQEKYRLLKSAYPLLASFILADMNEYDFARRETDARIEKKKKDLGI